MTLAGSFLAQINGQYLIPYSLDQTPLSNCRLTSGCAERNSRRSRILAAANIRVARAHVNKPRDSMAISKQAESIQWLQFKDCRKHSIMD